jgi:hypothetical protein
LRRILGGNTHVEANRGLGLHVDGRGGIFC